jgi:hypothetical protein
VRILAPAREAGMATLKVGHDIWNYLPRVDRTMKVPPGMMSGSWMGSHLTNDDLVKGSRLADDFDWTVSGGPGQPPGDTWVIGLVPHPDAPVVWGRVTVEVRVRDEMPVRILYYDEHDAWARTLEFSDVRTMGGRTFPARVTLTVADKPGESTEITYSDMQFGVNLPDSLFSLQGLRE